MSRAAQSEARHRRLAQRSMALARRDQFESIRRARVRHAGPTPGLQPRPMSAPGPDDTMATWAVGSTILAVTIATLWFFHLPLLAAACAAWAR